MSKLLRWEVDRQFHIIYEDATVMAKKVNFQANTTRIWPLLIHKHSLSPDSKKKYEVRSY